LPRSILLPVLDGISAGFIGRLRLCTAMRLGLLAITALSFLAFPASPSWAADPAPGGACSPDGLFARSGGAETSGVGHFLVCESSVWKSLMSFNGTGQLTEVGNQTCNTNDILKFDGAKWACASSAASAGSPDQVIFNSGGTLSGSDNLVFTSAGHLGIGTTDPVTALDVAGSARLFDTDSGINLTILNTNTTGASTYPNLNITNFAGATNGHPYIDLTNSRGSQGTQAANEAYDRLGSIVFNGGTGSGIAEGVRIEAVAASTFSPGSSPTYLTFGTTDTSGGNVERMRITPSGRVGIGSDAPASKLEVAGGIKIANDTDACTSAKGGTIRFISGDDPPWEYCDGGTTTWRPFRQPRCQDDGTGECYLDADRANDDPDFTEENIRTGTNVLNVTGSLIPAQQVCAEAWTPQAAAEANGWRSVTYGNGLFVAVATSGTNQVMTSSDGVTWTPRAAPNAVWYSVTYGNGLFVAVAYSGTDQVMTSPDGINWTAQTAAEANQWQAVTYGDGLFVAVAGNGTNQVMTSPDGINWTAQTAGAVRQWQSVVYGGGLFVAVTGGSDNYTVMTSPNGINWSSVEAHLDFWRSVTYGNGLFVAVANGCCTSRVMTSPDGTNWTLRTAAEQNNWRSVTYGNGLFVAVASGGTNRIMTSPDGINWTADASEANQWYGATYGAGLFVAVATSGTNRVMTSTCGPVTYCTDDDTSTCTIAANRADDDPDFTAANIADGVNILGVTGTLAAGGGCTAPASCTNVGDVCSDGSLFAGFMLYGGDSCEALYVTDDNQSTSSQWKNALGTDDINPDSYIDGRANAANRSGAISNFPAFDLCESNTYHGKSDWYLPAREELKLLWLSKDAIDANAAGTFTVSHYWSSTEFESTTDHAWFHYFGSDNQGNALNKTNTSSRHVRCVRRD
jgi:uncharacterized protein DUF1566